MMSNQLLYDRVKGLTVVLSILDEMTPDEMRKAGYSKIKIKAMCQWLMSTKSILIGLKEAYEKQLDEDLEA